MNADTRRAFLKKVLVTVTLQLLLTTGFVYIVISSSVLSSLFLENMMVFFIIGAIGSIGLAIGAKWCQGHPQDYFILIFFTLFESILLSCCCVLIDPEVILSAVLITVGITISLTVYALTTKTDFTGCGPYLFGAVCLLIFIGIFQIFGFFRSSIYSYIGAAIFSLYLIYDIQMCVGSEKFGNEYSVDDYVLAALNIYLDIINLFLYILEIQNRD